MSRYKFRAWNKKKQIMVYKNEDKSSDYWDGECASEVDMVNNILVEPMGYDWMQWTGLTDRGGRFEIEHTVSYDISAASYSAELRPHHQFSLSCGINQQWVNECNKFVVGNIHEGIKED